MTPTERAKNIASLLNYSPALADSNFAAVIKEIGEHEGEAFARGVQTGWKDREFGYAEGFRAGEEKGHKHHENNKCRLCITEGFNAAREKAKQIADDEECVVTDEVNCHGASRIAQRIGEMEA